MRHTVYDKKGSNTRAHAIVKALIVAHKRKNRKEWAKQVAGHQSLMLWLASQGVDPEWI